MSKKDRVLISILATMMLNTSTFSLFASADNSANINNTAESGNVLNETAPSEDAASEIQQDASEQTSESDPQEKTDVTEITEHSWGSWETEKESTITEAGIRIHTCTKCGKVERAAMPKQSLRICGSNRFNTAFEAAKQIMKENGGKKFNSIVIACGSDFADALSASYLSKVTDSPILLYGKAVEKQMIDFLKENANSSASIYIVGGTGPVSEDFEKSLKKEFTGKDQVKRLFGANRFGTNYAVLKEAQKFEKNSDGEVLVASGINYADALSASAVGKPVLLVAGKKLTDDQKAYLEAFKGKTATVIGGEGAVSKEIEKELKGYVSKTERLSGSNRFETSYLVAHKYFSKPSTIVLSYGLNYPDGLSGGPLALRYGSPLLLVANSQTQFANKFAAETAVNGDDMVSGTVTLGGETLISDDALKSIVTDELTASGLTSQTVKAAITISGQPSDWSGKPGETADLEIKAEGKDLKYQWQSSIDGMSWNDLEGKTTAALTVSAALSLNGTMYRCVVTSTCGETVISDAAKLACATLSVIEQPQSWSAAPDSDAFFYAQGSKDGLDYTWQYSTDNGKTWKNTTVKTPEYKVRITKTTSNRLVRCKMTDKTTGETITTNPVKLSECKDFKVVKQPAQPKGEIGSVQKIAAQVGGEGLTFQWQVSNNGTSGWKNVTGSSANKACLDQKVIPSECGKYFRCVVKDKNGKTITTKAVQLVSNETGFVEYAGKKYYMNSDHTPAKGIQKVGNDSYYFSNTGEMQTGLRKVNSALYLFDSESGKMKTGVNKVDSKVYCFGTDGKAVSGWQTDKNGDKYYFSPSTNAAFKGFKTIDSKQYYFNSDGVKTTGVILDTAKGKYRYIADTPVKNAFVTFNGAKYYIDKNGYAVTGLNKISGNTYYFGKNAAMVTGGYLIDGKRYFFDVETGKAITGIKERENGKKYYYNGANGVYTGLKKIGSDLYLFDSDGTMKYGQREVNGKYYYFDKDTGKAISGWRELISDSENAYMYYYSPTDHAAVTGLQKIGDDYYLFNENGFRLSGIQEVNGKSMLFDQATGKLYTGWYNNGTYTFYYDGLNGRIDGNKYVKIGEKYYFFSSNGPIVSGLKTVGDKTLYFDENDYSLVTGFVYTGGKVYYSDGLNGLKTGISTIDGNEYSFAPSLRTGAKTIDEKAYWFDENTGIRVTGIQYSKTDNKYYFYNTSGKMSGFIVYGGVKYNLSQNGIPTKGAAVYKNDSGKTTRVYFDTNTGEHQLGLITTTSSTGNKNTFYYSKTDCITDKTAISEINRDLDAFKQTNGWHELEGVKYYVSGGNFLKGIKEIDGKKYYFSELTGAQLEGLRRIGSDYYYFAGKGGSMLTGWQSIENKVFYFDTATGKMLTGLQTIGGKKYCLLQGGGFVTGTVMIGKDIYLFAEDGTGIKNNRTEKAPSPAKNANSWGTYDGGKCFFNQNGIKLTGLQLIDRKLYMFDSTGKMLKGLKENKGVLRCYTDDGALFGLHTVNGKLYYFDSYGAALKSKLIVIDDKTYYFTADGTAATGFCYVPDYLCTFYFDKDHTAHVGWLELDGKKYYYHDKFNIYPAGLPAHGITYIGKNTAYFDYETAQQKTGLIKVGLNKYMYFDQNTGYAISGLKSINGSTYYFSSAKESFGVSISGLATIGNDTYYFDPDTQKAVTGFVTIRKSTFYFGSNYKRVGGLQKIGNDLYYFDEKKGTMRTGLYSINSKRYYFKDDGKAMVGWFSTENGEKYYFSEKNNAAFTGMHIINGEKFFFSDNGKLKTGMIKDDSGKYHYISDETSAGGFVDYNGNTYYVDKLGNVLTGLQKINGSYYYFYNNGMMITGAYTVNGKSCFFSDDGKAFTGFVKRENGYTYYYNGINGVKTGLQKIGGKLYYLSDFGAILSGRRTIENKIYFFDSQSGAAQSGWNEYVTSIGDVYMAYYSPDDYTAVTGLKKIDGAYYYFSERGNALYGKQKVNNVNVYFDPNTFKLYTGYVKLNDKVYYCNGLKGLTLDKTAKTPANANTWGTIGGVKCYYGLNGKAVTGAQLIDKKLYMFDNNGKLMTGFIKHNGNTRYYTDKGIITGLQKIGSSYYYFSADDGYMVTGLRNISGGKYFFDKNGRRIEGWISYDGNHKCYITNSNDILTGLQKIDGKQYWFGNNGIMRIGIQTVTDSKGKNIMCLFDNDGAMVHGLVERYGNLYYYDETTGERVTGWKTIDGKTYYFSPTGGAALKGRQIINNVNYYFDTQTYEKKTGLIWYKDQLYCFNEKTKDGLTYGLTKIDGELYYFIENSGAAKTGFLNLDDVMYYFSEETGRSIEGIRWINNDMAYFFEKTGGIRKGLIEYEGKHYYLHPSTGKVTTGLVSSGNKLYCFDDNGEMMKNATVVKDGITYSIDDSGYVSVVGNGKIEKLIRSGIEKLGMTYWEETDERDDPIDPTTGFNCSGFVTKVLSDISINVTSTAFRQQHILTHSGKYDFEYVTSINDLKPGDIIYRSTLNCSAGENCHFFDHIHHTMIYIGDGRVIHSTATDLAEMRGVSIGILSDSEMWFTYKIIRLKELS